MAVTQPVINEPDIGITPKIEETATQQTTQQIGSPRGISAISNVKQSSKIPTTLDEFINTQLSIEEKRKLRFDLLSLPPEKLGEIMYVLQKSQPQNIEQKGDEVEIDLKKLNTKTMRHLQRYVESVFAKVRQNSMSMSAPAPQQNIYGQPQPQQMQVQAQPMGVDAGMHNMNMTMNGLNAGMMNPWPQQRHLVVGDLIPNDRKRSFTQMQMHQIGFNDAFRHMRKKRSAFTAVQKEQMISFWSTVNWQAVHEDDVMEAAAKRIGINVAQLKVFRQNNRKKYASPTQKSDENGNDGDEDVDVKGVDAESEQKNASERMSMSI